MKKSKKTSAPPLAPDQVDESRRNMQERRLGELLKETRVRVGTLLKTDNVSFLFGAGASVRAGGFGLAAIPLELEKSLWEKADLQEAVERIPQWLRLFYDSVSALTGQDYDPVSRRSALYDEADAALRIPVNLEEFLSQLHVWQAGMHGSASHLKVGLPSGRDLVVSRSAVDELIQQIKHSLASLLDLPLVGKEEALRYHRRLIKKVLTRPLNLRRINLFTLNYDTLIEKAADAEGVLLVDGFVGSLRRVFRPESYDVDFYFPAQTTEGHVHRFERAIHLYKLHGSITWHRCPADWENPYGVYASSAKRESGDDVLIYPSPLKYGQALSLPYSELFRRFGSAIAQPQSVLFTIGYGFGDEHVNALVRQALAIPSFTLVVIDPQPKSEFVLRLLEMGDERTWLVAGKELGTFEDFVERLLPDLREEEITARFIKTYETLDVQRLRRDEIL